jgi:hypothetical protein
MAVIYHPETEASVVVPDESVAHYRLSGWVTVDEWQEHLRLREQTEQAAHAAREGSAPAEDDTPARQPRKAALDKETK